MSKLATPGRASGSKEMGRVESVVADLSLRVISVGVSVRRIRDAATG